VAFGEVQGHLPGDFASSAELFAALDRYFQETRPTPGCAWTASCLIRRTI
jgi:hypothetical protein